jgi:TRAP-type C4-dicarboxylate transport system permease small subunit
MKAVVRKCCDHLARAVRVVVVILAAVMLASLTLQVVMRYVFGEALSWSEELALACFSWSMLLAIAVGVRDAIHVRMDLLVDRLPAPLRVGIDKLVTLAIAATGAFMAWAGLNYVGDSSGVTSAAIGYPIAYLYACAPVCGALIALFALENVLLGAPVQPATQSA